MRLDKNVLEAIKKVGHDRIVIHDTGIYSCLVTPETKMGDKATVMKDAAIVYGSKNIVSIGDVFITAPYTSFDLKVNEQNE